MLDGITCLIADDSPQQRDRNVAVAKKYGMKVLGVFSNGSDAVFAAKVSEPQVVFLDIVMKGQTGIEAAAELRKFSKAKIILVTASSQDSIIGLPGGLYDALLVKPFADERLLESVAAVMLTEWADSNG